MLSNFFRSLLLLSLITLTAHAQDTTGTVQIGVLGRAYGDSIVLRWAPASHVAWQQLNRVGYRVERYTILRDGELLEVPERQVLSSTPILPRPLPDWKNVVKRDSYAGIAAQALYGKTFEVSSSQRSDLVQMINQSQEQEQRFSFALFAADMSPTTAQYAGLRLTDRNVRTNEKYLYKVFSAQPLSVPLDTGLVFLSPSERTELVAPLEVSATFDDRRVMLRWNTYYHQSLYVAYRVERSIDGASFAPITELPITFPQGPDHYGYKSDSLPSNDVTYHYRVRGITSFGEVGPPSTVVSGQGRLTLNAAPNITEADMATPNTATIRWEVPPEAQPQVAHFAVEKAPKVDGPYRAVAPTLSPDRQAFTDPSVAGTNYYRVTAYGRHGETKRSFPVLVQAEDSIPPTLPAEFVGRIDTTGQVTLRWLPSPESDVFGYRIFRSNYPNRDFVQVTREPTADTTFVDQISLKNLTDSIYYKISVIDQRFNPSPLSAELILRKPDVIPPVAPVFKAAQPRAGGIHLSWIGSPSADVTHYLLYRHQPEETTWQLAGTTHATERQFTDTTVVATQTYEYVLLAVDEHQLESSPTPPLRAASLAPARKRIAHTYAEPDRQAEQILLRWDYDHADVAFYHIYRAEATGNLRWHHTVSAPQLQFSDAAVQQARTYQYRIKAVYTDGSQSPLSEVVQVSF